MSDTSKGPGFEPEPFVISISDRCHIDPAIPAVLLLSRFILSPEESPIDGVLKAFPLMSYLPAL